MEKINMILICITSTLIFTRTVLADLSDGVVAYYPLNGNANDFSGNGNDGIIYGATSTSDRFGSSDSAYQFDGVDDYISAGDSSYATFSENESFSVGAWVQTGDDFGGIVSKMSNTIASYAPGFQLWVDNNVFALEYGATGTEGYSHTLLGSVNISDNQWHHVMGIVDKQNDLLEIYVDGVSDGSYSASWISFTSENIGDFRIGASRGPFGPPTEPVPGWSVLGGKLDDVSIYNRTLSETEVQQLYVVPEPVSSILFVTGGVVLAGRRYFRRKK
jgi:hypothetical protein